MATEQPTKAQIKRAIAGRKCAAKLEAAVEALNAYMSGCNTVGDASAVRGADDGRLRLVRDMQEYAIWLQALYDKEPAHAR